MDWGFITWGLVIGIIGMAWMMILAVLQTRASGPRANQVNESSQEPEKAAEEQRRRQRARAA